MNAVLKVQRKYENKERIELENEALYFYISQLYNILNLINFIFRK